MKWVIRIFILLWSLFLTVGGDTSVTCLFSKECLLPCKSKYFDVIHWHKLQAQEIIVHSYYEKADQLQYQDAAYKGRTSMFTEQIPKGNASLLLRGVRVQDGGRYKCYTASRSTTEELYVTVNVKAPITSVDIKATDKGVICNTKEVYPKPQISWYIDNVPQDPKGDEDEMKEEQGLFSLTSILTQSVQKNLTYSCKITFGDETYTASLREEKKELDTEELSIPCPRSQGDTGPYELIVTFDSSVIMRYDSGTPNNKEQWKDADLQLTQDGNVQLSKLDSEKHAGDYICERRTDHSKQMIMTSVQSSKKSFIQQQSGKTTIAVIVVIIIVIVGLFAAFIIRNKYPKTNRNSKGASDKTSKSMQTPEEGDTLTEESNTDKKNDDESNDQS